MEDYLKNRVKPQQKWYEKKATTNKKKFIQYQTIIIVLGATIPVIVSLEMIFDSWNKWGGPLTAFISAIISIVAGLDKLLQPQPNWFNYRANEEMIKKEEWYFKYQTGPYGRMKSSDADKLLVERIESLISADIARTTNQERKNHQDEIEKVPK